MMTIWHPQLDHWYGPRYLAIADALADDIATGKLKAGDRLPTHRELAYNLGLTVGTVTRAYGEADARGLTIGEVGRGTFVCGASRSPSATTLAVPDRHDPNIIDFGLNLPVSGNGAAHLAAALGGLSRAGNGLRSFMEYQPERGLAHHRAAGSDWLRRIGLIVDPERIVVTNGGQHGIATIFMALSRPGSLVLTESLSWPGMKDVADHLNLRLQGIAMDDQGLRADALEAACRSAQAKMLYILPTLQNPTGAVMSIERRREIIAVARQFDLTIVEDDVYGFLLGDDRPPPLVALAPDIVYYVTSMAKCLMPGLRVGFVATPPGAAEAIGGAMRTTVRMTAPLMAEITAGWIADGSADAMAAEQRSAVEIRQALAQRILKDFPTASDPSGFHIWLTLPDGWSSADVVGEAQRQGVVVMGAAPFRVGRGPEPQAIRICLGGPEVALDVERGLEIIAALLHRKSLPNRAII